MAGIIFNPEPIHGVLVARLSERLSEVGPFCVELLAPGMGFNVISRVDIAGSPWVCSVGPALVGSGMLHVRNHHSVAAVAIGGVIEHVCNLAVEALWNEKKHGHAVRDFDRFEGKPSRHSSRKINGMDT